MRENKDLSQWRDKPCSWIRRLNIIKILFLPKLIYAIPIGVFVELDKMIQGQGIARTLSKKNKVRGFVLQITKFTIKPQ